jgi:hypothetical protein
LTNRKLLKIATLSKSPVPKINSTQTMASYDDLNTRQIWIVGTISAVLTGVTILAVQVLYFALLNWHDETKLAGSEYAQSIEQVEAQTVSLTMYGRGAEGQIVIPIDRAMELVVERSNVAEAADKQPGKKVEEDNAT